MFPDETKKHLVSHRFLVGDLPTVLAHFFDTTSQIVGRRHFAKDMFRFCRCQPADNLHLEASHHLNVDHTFFHALWQGSSDFPEKFNPFETVDHLFGDRITRFYFRGFQPSGRTGENSFVRLVQLLKPRKLTDGVRYIDSAGRHQLQSKTIRINRIVMAYPLERLRHNLEVIFIQIDEIPFQGALMEKPVHQATGRFQIQIQYEGTFLLHILNQHLQQQFRLNIHFQGGTLIRIDDMIHVRFFTERNPFLFQIVAVLEMPFVNRRDKAHVEIFTRRLRRAFVNGLDTIIPNSNFAITFPCMDFTLHLFQICHGFHETRERKPPLTECIGDVVPEFQNVGRRHRPEFQRFVSRNFPAGIQTHHVVIMDFLLNGEPAVALFELGDIFGFLVIQFAFQLLFENIQKRNIVKFIWGFGEILTAVHTLHHRRIHRRSRYGSIVRRTGSEPAVPLQTKAYTVDSMFILHAALNKEMVSENLRYGAIFL